MKQKNFFKAMALLTASCVLLSTAACGKKETGKISGDDKIPQNLSVFCRRDVGTLKEDMIDYNDIYSFKLLEEKTGCHVNWVIPPSTGLEERFNLMIASGDLTDVIVYDWKKTGVDKYAYDGVILEVGKYMKEYMPNFTKFTNENPELAKQYVYEDNKVYYFPYIRTDSKLNIFTGPLVRTDWLDKLGIKSPENSEELYEVLKAFKTRDPNGNGEADEIPMTGSGAFTYRLLYMFDTTHDFYLDGDTVKYGIMEPKFEEGAAYMAKLYAEGLIDPDYILQDRTTLRGKVTNNKAGFAFEYQPTVIMNTMASVDPSFKFAGIPNLKSDGGKNVSYDSAYINSVYSYAGAALTKNNKAPLGTLRWLDYIFSDEGHMIMNFGKEGETYNMVDGEPQYTDLILKNEKYPLAEAFSRNFGSFNSYFPVTQDWRAYSKSLSNEGKQAIETWSDVDTSGILPSLTFTAEQQDTINDVMGKVKTYADEKLDKIILGHEKTENLPEIRDAIKQMGIDKVLSIYQEVYNQYKNKKITF